MKGDSDAFGNALGNSVVRAGQSQPKLSVGEYDKLRGGINTIGQDLSADLKINNDAALEKSLSNAEQQRATDLTTVTDSFNYDNVQAVSFANSQAGVDFATSALANLQGLNRDLAVKQTSVISSKARVNDLVSNNVNNQLSEVRRSPVPYQGISDNELKGFLGTNILADDFVGSAFDRVFGPLGSGTLANPYLDDYLNAKSFYTKLSTGVGALGVSSESLFSALNAGWGVTSNIGNKPNLMWFDPKLTSVLDYSFAAPVVDTIGKVAAFAAPFVSALNGVNETIWNPNGYDNTDVARETGKFATDSLAAATALSQFARFSPLGIACTALDIGVQNFVPEYTIQYGTYSGDTADGWSGLMHRSTDYEAYKIQNGLSFDRPTK